MASTPTRFSGPQQLTGSATTQYTCPAASIAVVRCIHVSNPSSSPVGLTVSIGADAAATRIYDAFAVAQGAQDLFCYYPLAAGEEMQAFASTTATLTLTISGDLRTP